MDVENFKIKLGRYSKEDIIFTIHAKIRADFRGIDMEEIIENIRNPKKLKFVKESEEKSKYECYFAYSKTHCHKYILALSGPCV